jgi:hypothetical protein
MCINLLFLMYNNGHMVSFKSSINGHIDSKVFLKMFCWRIQTYFIFSNCNNFLQIELFGRKFEPGEFDRMPPAEQQDKSDKMMSTIQKWREERRAKELKQGIR